MACSDHSYHELKISDNYEDASSAEAQELLSKAQQQSRPRGAWAKVRSNWWIVNTSLLLVILTLLLIEPQWHKRPNYYEFAGDLTGFGPRFSQSITTFKPDLSFVPENTSEFWTDAVQDKWLGIVPRGLGYVRVENPSQYDNLPQPIHDYTNMTVFTTSMPHQLHCLYNILAVYSAITSENPRELPTEMTFHLQHCFEYLRLSIMCCGDVALEGAETTFPDGFDGSDGWDARHVCKDYDQIYEYLDENRASDRQWI
ncbi:hypothetical protein FQN52_001717 [Onygenales sp. PD_12]|nr:hypothetical protein FQN52_001717 [Onygenales sp. PD_12]